MRMMSERIFFYSNDCTKMTKKRKKKKIMQKQTYFEDRNCESAKISSLSHIEWLVMDGKYSDTTDKYT